MNTKTASRFALVAALPAAFIMGCAADKPIGTVAKAEMAIDHAQRNRAPEYALAELESAEMKLALARDAMDDGDNDEARKLAEQALAEAKLAEAKAESGAANQAVSARITELRREVGQMGVTTTETTVVQQNPSPSVVVVP